MKKVLITAGKTTEKIDGIRGITNFATGSLGKILVEKFLEIPTIEKIFFLTSEKTHLDYFANNQKIKTHLIFSIHDLEKISEQILTNEKIDVIIPTMAVSDFTPQKMVTNEVFLQWLTTVHQNLNFDFENNKQLFNSWLDENNNLLSQNTKISSNQESILFLAKTPKIIQKMRKWAPNAFFVGFKLLVNAEESKLLKLAPQLIENNQYDLLVLNDWLKIKDINHQALIVSPENYFIRVQNKTEVAEKIIAVIINKEERDSLWNQLNQKSS